MTHFSNPWVVFSLSSSSLESNLFNSPPWNTFLSLPLTKKFSTFFFPSMASSPQPSYAHLLQPFLEVVRLPKIQFLTLFSSHPQHASQAVLPPPTIFLLFPQPNLPPSFFCLQTLKSNFPVDYIHLRMPTNDDSSLSPQNYIIYGFSHSLQNQ